MFASQGADVTGSWLLKIEVSWLASNYCVREGKEKKKKREIWAFGDRCQLTEIQQKVYRQLSEYGLYPSQLSEDNHLPATAYFTS